MEDKAGLRARLRQIRSDYARNLPQQFSALMFLRPPVAVAQALPEGAPVGLYHAVAGEAPTRAYAKWLLENGRPPALPWFADKGASMAFRLWLDPYDDEGLERGPFGMQPTDDAPLAEPAAVFVPLVGFTADGQRLGQGGGHYDRWLAAHPAVPALGLAWECQRVEQMPSEPHDVGLSAVITPQRLYGQWNAAGASSQERSEAEE